MPAKAQFTISEELNKAINTSKFRASYVHLLEPWTGDPDKTAKYSIQCIFDKDDKWITEVAKPMVAAIAKEAFGPNAVKLMRAGKLRNPFRDGDAEFEDDETYKGKVFFNANGPSEGKKPPRIVDRKLRNVRDFENPEDTIYSGCYCRASVKFYPYDQKGGKGVAVYLFDVQVMGHGEPLSGAKPIDQVFDQVDGDDDDDAFADDF